MVETTALPEEIEKTVENLLALAPEYRLAISRRLAASIEVDAQWAKVATRRAEELRSGKVQGVSIDEAFDQAQRAVDAIRSNAS